MVVSKTSHKMAIDKMAIDKMQIDKMATDKMTFDKTTIAKFNSLEIDKYTKRQVEQMVLHLCFVSG